MQVLFERKESNSDPCINWILSEAFRRKTEYFLPVQIVFTYESPGLVVKGGRLKSEGCESESWHQILVEHFLH